MERFDYLVWQLKKRGIYTNLNLNVFRKYKAGDGVRDFGPLYFGKSATYFNPRLLELQRDYARKLLTHRNRYTGNEYRHEPAVSCVELVNENSVLEGWVNWRLVGRDEEHPGTWSPIPVSYAQELTEQLNDWFAANTIRPKRLAGWRKEAGVGRGTMIPCLKTEPIPGGFARAVSRRGRSSTSSWRNGSSRTMGDLLKEELGVQSLVIGTADHNDWILRISAYRSEHAAGLHRRARLLAASADRRCDQDHEHARWSTIRGIRRSSSSRARPLQGLPYTISETNHPFPHEYACEGIPSLTAYAHVARLGRDLLVLLRPRRDAEGRQIPAAKLVRHERRSGQGHTDRGLCPDVASTGRGIRQEVDPPLLHARPDHRIAANRKMEDQAVLYAGIRQDDTADACHAFHARRHSRLAVPRRGRFRMPSAPIPANWDGTTPPRHAG